MNQSTRGIRKRRDTTEKPLTHTTTHQTQTHKTQDTTPSKSRGELWHRRIAEATHSPDYATSSNLTTPLANHRKDRDRANGGTFLHEKHHHRGRRAPISRDQTMTPEGYWRSRRAACGRVHATCVHEEPQASEATTQQRCRRRYRRASWSQVHTQKASRARTHPVV